MWLRILHAIGLTNLTEDQVSSYYSHHRNLSVRTRALNDSASALPNLCRRYSATPDQVRDIELFLRDGRNFMDPAQLAEGQVSDPPHQIHVVAPVPLETKDDTVFQSTLKWLRYHIAQSEARIVFWTTTSQGDNPPLVTIVQRLLIGLDNDHRVLERIECVRAPDDLFLADYTIWRYPNGKLRAFLNERRHGVTNRLFEINEQAAHELFRRLYNWLEGCDEDVLVIFDPSQKMAGLADENMPNYIRCRTVRRLLEASEIQKQPSKVLDEHREEDKAR